MEMKVNNMIINFKDTDDDDSDIFGETSAEFDIIDSD